MTKDCRWTSPENEQKMKNYGLAKRELLSIPQNPLYHYTSREVFWKIMDGESLLARHIMFSNDSQENEIGKNKLAKAMKKVMGCSVAETAALPFMICFCEDGDLLSQWRGYANEGIALEFDFTKGLYGKEKGFSSNYCYTVMNKEPEESYLSDMTERIGKTEKIFMGAVISPHAVIYTNEEDTDGSVAKSIEKIKDMQDDGPQQTAISLIPYIKNDKFNEEKEYRLIFDMNQLAFGKYQSLLKEKYVYLDVNGVRKPNIRIKFGNQYRAENEADITIYYMDDAITSELKKLKKELEEELKKESKESGKAREMIIRLVRKVRKYKMEPQEILISEGKNQERVCTLLRQMLPDKEWNVWCDGHLPIRRIIVGPSKDAKLMKNSIEEYLKTKYWTRDIKVDISGIPLRT